MTESKELQGTVLVVRGDETVHEASGGFAAADGTPCAPDLRFQLASVSKQFTAAATLLEVEAGRVRLDDPVGAFIPGCPSSWDDITVHHLLTHTAGLNHWPDHRAELDLCAWIEPAAAIREFQRLPLRFAPGTNWYYSSPGYVLLAHIVEATAGSPYRTYLEQAIFTPVGLADTFAGMPAADAVRLAEPYSDGAATPSFELDSIGMGAGDVWSTTHDLVRWDRTLAAGEFLSARSRELTFAPHARTVDRLADHYGYGWQLGTINGHRVRFHQGGNAGFCTFNAWFPDLDACIVVLSNDDTTDSQELTIKLAKSHL